jgi:hypothetical protein
MLPNVMEIRKKNIISMPLNIVLGIACIMNSNTKMQIYKVSPVILYSRLIYCIRTRKKSKELKSGNVCRL